MERDLAAGEEKLEGLQGDLDGVEKAQKRAKGASFPPSFALRTAS